MCESRDASVRLVLFEKTALSLPRPYNRRHYGKGYGMHRHEGSLMVFGNSHAEATRAPGRSQGSSPWFLHIFLCAILLLAFAVSAPLNVQAQTRSAEEDKAAGPGNRGRIGMKQMKRASRDFDHIDEDNDGKISLGEWRRRGNFESLDKDGDGYLSEDEMSRIYFAGRRGKLLQPIVPGATPEMDSSVQTDRVAVSKLDSETYCSVTREPRCGVVASADRGLRETGIGPMFPKHANCLGIDDYYAMSYSHKRNSATVVHGGMDIPAPQGTPILAVAAGTVVGKFLGKNSQRGIEIVLRHSPEDTGRPFWTYTQYAHLSEMPVHVVGQRVRRGEVIGLTGSTGIDASSKAESTHRRPAIHFAAWFSLRREFAEEDGVIIPVESQWMDPNAMYRNGLPYDSRSLSALPEGEKFVSIPVMFIDGTTQPADTKLIWPYTCARQ